MAPPALAAVWVGGYAFALMVAVAAAIMAWEWHTITLGGFGWSGRLTAALSALAVLATIALPPGALPLLLVGAAVAPWLARDLGRDNARARSWALFGALYIGLPAIALVWLRGEGAGGRGEVPIA